MKELKLKTLQELFAGTIKKVSNKYVVTFPNSNREYTYKCNLQELAKKLDINISGLLADDCTYNNDKKSDHSRWQVNISNTEKVNILLKESVNLLPEAIRGLYNKCLENPFAESLKDKEINYSLYLIINLKTEKVITEIKQWEVFADIKIPTTSYKHYIQITTLSNKVNYGLHAWDNEQLEKHIEKVIAKYN